MGLRVKAHQPWKTVIFLTLIVIALAIAGWSLFDYGRFLAGFDSQDAGREQQLLMGENDDLNDRIVELRGQKAVLERAAQIEREAYNQLDTTLKTLQAEIIELKAELAFYRGIVSPRDASRGLRLQSFALNTNGQTRGYRYTLVLTQVLKNDRLVYGRVNLSFAGIHNGQPKVLGLNEVTKKSVKELKFRFKYFQNIEGDIVLPVGFTPLRVMIKILPRGRQQDMIEKTFDWPIKEDVTHVGK